jgi:hypothetical protein
MAEHETGTTEGPNQSPAGVLTDGQRATFRSAGLWMAIIGWAEVLFGAVAGLVWLLAALGALPGRAVDGAPSEWSLRALQVVGSVIIGVLTLIAARSFRRAGRDPAAGLPAVTAAVADLAELYERQVWLAFALLAIAIGGALANWW